MISINSRAALLALVAVAWGSMAGCYGVHGSDLEQETTSSVQYRYEWEFIPNAELVREDTPANPEYGRFAFIRGADRLLVLTRITSVAGVANRGTGGRRDIITERLWITVPLDVQVGETLELAKLEERFLVGYDEDDEGHGFFIQPSRLVGTITMREQRPDTMVADLIVVLKPRYRDNWALVEKAAEIPIVADGVHGTLATGEAPIHSPSRRREITMPVFEQLNPLDAPTMPQPADSDLEPQTSSADAAPDL